MAKVKKTLKELRKNIRFTQKEVSEATGIPFSTYVSYELGYRRAKLDTAQKLANFYKCKIGDIDFEPNKKEEK